MSEAKLGIVTKGYDKPTSSSIYIKGVEGGHYLPRGDKAANYPTGTHIKYVTGKAVGKGFAIEKIRKLEPDEIAELGAPPEVSKTGTPVNSTAPAPGAPTDATKAAKLGVSETSVAAVRSYAEVDAERQRTIIVQSCQKVAVDMLKIYLEKEAFTLGAAVNKRKAVIDAFFNGLVYDLYMQVINGPQPLDGKPEDAKPVAKAKKGKAASEAPEPDEGPTADDTGDNDPAADGVTFGDLDDLP